MTGHAKLLCPQATLSCKRDEPSGHVGTEGKLLAPGIFEVNCWRRCRRHRGVGGSARREDVGGMLRHISFQHVRGARQREIRAACEGRSRGGHHARVAQCATDRQRPDSEHDSRIAEHTAVRCCLLIASYARLPAAVLRVSRIRTGIGSCWKLEAGSHVEPAPARAIIENVCNDINPHRLSIPHLVLISRSSPSVHVSECRLCQCTAMARCCLVAVFATGALIYALAIFGPASPPLLVCVVSTPFSFLVDFQAVPVVLIILARANLRFPLLH